MTPSTPEPLSNEELDQIRLRHRKADGGWRCTTCYMVWPCDAARLLSELDRYVAELDKCARLLVDANGETLRAEAALDAEREKLKALDWQVKNWERKETERGSCCADNEERAERAEAERDKLMAVVEAARFLVEVGYHTGGVGTNAIRAALAALDAGEAQHGTKDKP